MLTGLVFAVVLLVLPFRHVRVLFPCFSSQGLVSEGGSHCEHMQQQQAPYVALCNVSTHFVSVRGVEFGCED